MRLLFSTSDLLIGGRSVEGFPLLINDACEPFMPAQDFLLHILLENGLSQKKLTWEATGRRLYDYFAFLNANGLEWDDVAGPVGSSPVARYRDWSAGELGLSSKTINSRLALISRFYEWAFRRKIISSLPFSYRQAQIRRDSGLLAHVNHSQATRDIPSVMLRSHKSLIKLLTAEQAKECSLVLTNQSHHILFSLMIRSGLRSCEARSFPAKYVFDPASRRDLQPGQMIRIDLDPKDMEIKYDKARSVDVPWRLMEQMNTYKNLEREVRLSRSSHTTSALVVSEFGTEMCRSNVVALFLALSRKLQFKVTAHMLRHTYATFTLMALRKSEIFRGEPLLYVRDRLGHSDVQTTMEYLHLINEMEAKLVLQHDQFINSLFDFGSAP